MSDWVLAHQSAARFLVFFALTAAFLLLEWRLPRRRTPMYRRLRWPSNFGLMIVNTAAIFALPVVAVTSAVWAHARGWGAFNQLAWPEWLEVLAAWMLLDLAIYWQHRALHEVRFLWPLHRPHHTDVEFDVSTGVRFHPFEVVGSMLYKCLLVVLLGAPLAAVLLFEITLNGLSMFNHANLRLDPRFDRILRMFLVTPDMHRAHHSIHRDEHDSNYSNAFSWWDRLFGSYTAQPREGHEQMRIGLPQLRDSRDQRLWRLLGQPLTTR